jgi:hypothetical protein
MRMFMRPLYISAAIIALTTCLPVHAPSSKSIIQCCGAEQRSSLSVAASNNRDFFWSIGGFRQLTFKLALFPGLH